MIPAQTAPRKPCAEPAGWAGSDERVTGWTEPRGWSASLYKIRGREYIRLSKMRPGKKGKDFFLVEWYLVEKERE